MRDLKSLDPAKCAVVIVDLQKGYCDPTSDCAQRLGWDVGDADRVCQKHVKFLSDLRELLPSKQIIWLRMEEAAETIAPNMHYGPHLGDKLFVALCVRGTKGHEFHIVSPAATEPVFLKFHFSGFGSKEFRDYLAENKITQLIFTGVIASRCVNATLVTASALGFECMLITDLIAGPSLLVSEINEHVKLTSFFYAQPVESKNFIAQLKKSKRQY